MPPTGASAEARASVASGHPEVTAAARETLRAGGNAFDAAVAAGFASTVAEPTLSSLGGGGFLLAHGADGGAVVYDFFVDTPGRGRDPRAEPQFEPVLVHFPGAVQEFHVGLGASAVPGCLAGLLHVHRELGSLPLEDLVAPAVRLAREGLAVSAFQAHVLELLQPVVTLHEDVRALFAPHGDVLAAGDRFHNPDLADFLEALPASATALYEGELGAALVARMEAAGGLMTMEDLAAYRVIERSPLAFSFGGRRGLTNPLPSFGGELIVHALELLDRADLGAWGSAAHLHALVDAMAAQATRRARSASGGRPGFPRGTTHLSVIDADGNAAGLSISNGESCGATVPGTGIVLNNMLGEDDLHPHGFHRDPPGVRIGSMMAPTMLLDDGRVDLVLGSGGSKRIRTAIVQVLLNVVAFGLPLEAAVRAPRLHLGDRLEVEPGVDVQALTALGDLDRNVWDERSMFFGGVHAAGASGRAAGDPRRDGSAWSGPT